MFFWGKKSEDNSSFASLLLNIKADEQVTRQLDILQRMAIIKVLSDGKSLGITGIDGKEYIAPTLVDVMKRLEGKKEFLAKKIKQGFTKIILVPFAAPIETIIKKYEETLIGHKKAGKLLATKENELEPDANMDLDPAHPINVWNEYKDGDIKNSFFYFPKKHDAIKHEGKTKLQLLADPMNAWQIVLVENMPNIPSLDKGKKIGGRKQIEAGKTPMDYLNMLKTKKDYVGEEGLSPEADLSYAITHLEETNQVINDWGGNGNLSYELGAFFASSDSVPCLGWNRDFNRSDLWKFSVTNKDLHIGIRVGIRI